MTKQKDIMKYSNPEIVFKKANEIFDDLPFEIELSTRKTKKYMIRFNDKWIHFGQMGYEDYTKHSLYLIWVTFFFQTFYFSRQNF